MTVGQTYEVNGVKFTITKIQDSASFRKFISVEEAIAAGTEEKYLYIHNLEYRGCHQYSWLKTKLKL